MTPDIFNGLLEFVCAVMLCLDIRALAQDGDVAGISIGARGFFWCWSIWNLWWYPHLDQWFSFAGAVCVLVPQTLWIYLLVRYRSSS
jgi:hypothetical protein